MRSDQLPTAAATALAPLLWGTTYVITTEVLPPDRPLFVAATRAVPAALCLLLVRRARPRGEWWWRSAALGMLNVGVFFALLFFAAYRLPGGVVSTIGALNPLVATLLAWPLLGRRPTARAVLSAVAGAGGVALLVLRSSVPLDAAGLAASFGGMLSVALGLVLTERFGRPVERTTFVAWQLGWAGLFLAALALLVEGAPPALDAASVAGLAYLSLLGTAFAYWTWFRGLERLSSTTVASLVLLIPCVATTIDVVALDRPFAPLQGVGLAIVLASVLAALGVDRALRGSPS